MLYQIFSYIKFIFSAKSPQRIKFKSGMTHKLISDVFNYKEIADEEKIIRLRKEIANDRKQIHNITLGAPSKVNSRPSINVAKIMKITGVSHKTGILLHTFAKQFAPATILELGTGIGISTLYMALGQPEAQIITIEGSKEKSDYAENLFKREGLNNVQFYKGTFDKILTRKIQELKHPLLVFIDGDHSFRPTINYFNIISKHANEDTIIIFDDIHWSKEMGKAWNYISANESLSLIIDIFHLGIVFFNKKLAEQKIILKY